MGAVLSAETVRLVVRVEAFGQITRLPDVDNGVVLPTARLVGCACHGVNAARLLELRVHVEHVERMSRAGGTDEFQLSWSSCGLHG